MFFLVSGVDTKAEHLCDARNVVCPNCGAYTCLHITLLYERLHLFFVPVLKWNRRYLATAPCCGTVFELEREEGEAFRRGEKKTLDPSRLHKTVNPYGGARACPNCGAALPCGAKFCPQCGKTVG